MMDSLGQDMMKLLRKAAIKAGITVLNEMDAGQKGSGPPGSKKQPAKKKKNTKTPKRKKKGK